MEQIIPIGEYRGFAITYNEEESIFNADIKTERVFKTLTDLKKGIDRFIRRGQEFEKIEVYCMNSWDMFPSKGVITAVNRAGKITFYNGIGGRHTTTKDMNVFYEISEDNQKRVEEMRAIAAEMKVLQDRLAIQKAKLTPMDMSFVDDYTN